MNNSDILYSSGSPRATGQARPEADLRAFWAARLAGSDPANAVKDVEGDFAVAATRADGSVFLAVDRFAVRTLCYRVVGSTLRVAGRADELADSDTPVSVQALFDYLYFHIIPSPSTVFSGVHRLPPGHCAVFRDGRVTVTPYWHARFGPTDDRPFEQRRAEFRDRLREAVSRQVDGSRPACFLSGGTDSSTVTGMLAELSGTRPTAYSVGFEADGYDEMAYARLAAKRFGCEHREIYFTPEHLIAEIPVVAAAYDQPFGNSSVLPSFHCARQAHEDGVTRILAGDGGDELFGGNERYATQRLFEPWQRLPAGLRSGLLQPLFGLPVMARLPLLRKGASYVRQASTPMPDRMQDYNLIKRIGYTQIFTDGFLGRVQLEGVDRLQREVWAEAETDSELNRHLAFDWRFTLAECDLPKVVGSTTLAGLGVGFPMLDDGLLAFSQRLPIEDKVRGRQLRCFFKEALRGFLPDEIIDKKKQGFGLPFGVWMARHPQLNTMTRDALGALAARKLVREGFVRQFFDELLPQHPHYYGTLAWILIMLEHWLRGRRPSWTLES